jgi:hypothetical protein
MQCCYMFMLIRNVILPVAVFIVVPLMRSSDVYYMLNSLSHVLLGLFAKQFRIETTYHLEHVHPSKCNRAT